ncbi:MAG: hypothetical protein IPF99_32680 [Deltaproteobacteria bacterium]|nr:hypothetical protein [Deltaproteobacteria bacterium]
MLDVEQRAAILALTAKGRGVRTVARLVGASRNAVRRVLAEGKAVPDPVEREVQARPHFERIATLFTTCQGNLVRVREVLADEDRDRLLDAPRFAASTASASSPRCPSGATTSSPARRCSTTPPRTGW